MIEVDGIRTLVQTISQVDREQLYHATQHINLFSTVFRDLHCIDLYLLVHGLHLQ